ncbi:MAG: AbrB/MazE/SpoVT family DNA-binding domain-containing protein [Steroidobacteraceae bacterium]|jgi:AbrB family looped-hinge helix DNA binding protein
MTSTVLHVEEPPARWNPRAEAGPAPKSPSSAQAPQAGQGTQAAQATVSSKGQVTLPAAMRAQLGIGPGSQIRFELRGRELVIKPELPISAYYGILKGYDLGDIEPEKEPDREFD